MVPNGWEIKKLDNVFKVFDSLHKTPTFSDDGFAMVRVTDIKGGYLDLNNTTKVSSEVFTEFTKKYKPKASDIVFSRVGSYGISSYAATDTPFCLGQNTVIAESNSSANSLYIFNVLKGQYVKRQIERTVDGSSHKTVSLKIIRNLDIPIPPMPEQHKIAKILSTWDKAISTTERLIDNSKQQKKALMQQLLTGKKRLLDDSGKPFQGEWEKVIIGTTSKCFSGGTPSRNKEEYYGGNIPWITSGKLNDRFVSTVNEYISELGLRNSSAKVVKNGSLLIAMYGATAGKVAINKLNGATVNQAVLALEPMEHCHNLFLFYLFEVEMVKALKLVQGGQPNLSAAIIKNIKIKLPPLDEQQKIASILTAADKEIELLEQQLTDLKQEKKALMQQLLTGKRRVTIDSESAA